VGAVGEEEDEGVGWCCATLQMWSLTPIWCLSISARPNLCGSRYVIELRDAADGRCSCVFFHKSSDDDKAKGLAEVGI
jgi:hypothetical protein